MQKTTKILIGAGILLASFSCSNSGEEKSESNATAEQQESVVGQSGVQDDVSAKNVVQVASGSKECILQKTLSTTQLNQKITQH